MKAPNSRSSANQICFDTERQLSFAFAPARRSLFGSRANYNVSLLFPFDLLPLSLIRYDWRGKPHRIDDDSQRGVFHAISTDTHKQTHTHVFILQPAPLKLSPFLKIRMSSGRSGNSIAAVTTFSFSQRPHKLLENTVGSSYVVFEPFWGRGG